ncbi:hypothetical protein BDB01DRAFT_525383 [Pilobolus umbonatus]|nr:hypothetical protein BDB01DRAFT_525383 [Pilobolus umbonatus]
MKPLKLWLDALRNKGYSTFVDSQFFLQLRVWFVSPWQKEPLLAAESICLDASHNITNIKNGVQDSIVIRHLLTDTGSPIAFFFTTDQSMWPLSRFLMFTVNKITIDMSKTEKGDIVKYTQMQTLQLVLSTLPGPGQVRSERR